jgi:hypothetical protein
MWSLTESIKNEEKIKAEPAPSAIHACSSDNRINSIRV